MSEVISVNTRIENHAQTVRLTELLRFDQHRLRITINANSYRDQSSAYIERWSGERWEMVYCINGGGMRTEVDGLYVRPEFAPRRLREEDQSSNITHAFRVDRAALIARAIEVLGR